MNIEINLKVVRALMIMCRKSATVLAKSTRIDQHAIEAWTSGKSLTAQAVHPENQLRLMTELGMKDGDLDRSIVHHWDLDETRDGMGPLQCMTEAFGRATAYSLGDYHWGFGRKRRYVLHFERDYVAVLHLRIPLLRTSSLEQAGVELLTEPVLLSETLQSRIEDRTVRLWELESAVDMEDTEVWSVLHTASREYRISPQRILNFVIEQSRIDEEAQREAARVGGDKNPQLLENQPPRDLGAAWLRSRKVAETVEDV